MKKVFFSSLLVVVIAISLVGCSGNSSGSNTNLNPETTMSEAVGGNSTDSNTKLNPETIMGEAVSGEITVSAYEAIVYKSYLEEAARKFEAKYPGTKVMVDVVGNMPDIGTSGEGNVGVLSDVDRQEKDDYISRVNTELMSGEGADVIALDILPYYKYADSGQLVDMQNFMAQDDTFKKDEYAGNILDGAKYNGGQFLFPIDYTFSYFSYDSSLSSDFPQKDKLTFTEVISAVKNKSVATGNKIFGIPSYTGKGPSLVMEMLNINYQKFIDIADKKVNFNDGEFAKLLNDAKSYADEGLINEARVSASGGMSRPERGATYYAKINSNLALTNIFMRGLGAGDRAVVAEGSIGAISENDEIAGLVADDKGEVQFSYTMGFGINSNSKNKRTAWEFVKFLASEEMQGSGLGSTDSIPVNRVARERLAMMRITGKADTELTSEQKTALEGYLQQLDQFTAQLNKYVVHDEKIDSMIQDELKSFFAGERSAEEAANALQSKVSLYLNE